MVPPTAPVALWRDDNYRRLWFSLLLGAFAAQMATLALSLTAANLLHATPTQIGMLGAMGTAPFALFMLPAGVWLDRQRKLPVYLGGELTMAALLACVPLAWALDRLAIELLYAVAFVSACVSVVAGTAGQIVGTQVVRREQLVEAHTKNRVAGSVAEIAGPGIGGMLIKLAGAPLAIVGNCALLLCSAAMLRRLRLSEAPVAAQSEGFWPQLKEGVRFVRRDRLLLSMALTVGCWQVCQTCAMVTQVLFATRELGMNEFEFGLCLTGAGIGTVLAGSLGHALAQRIGPGPSMIAGIALSGIGWLQLAWSPKGSAGIAAFVFMQACFASAVVLIFSNMLALRQALTPAPLLARMTSTMRWLTLIPAWPGTLLGGVLAEHYGLRFPVLVGGVGAAVLALWLWRFSTLAAVRDLAGGPARS